MRLLLIFSLLFFCEHAFAQESTQPNVLVQGEANEFEEPGDYGQPQWAERSQASATTKLYVLSAYEAFAGFFCESDFPRRGKAFHQLMQEFEIGLPHRFEIGFENHVDIRGSRAAETIAAVEARYAFAVWGAIPLNPAIAGEYRFGLDNTPGSDSHQSDACEVRLLVGQEFVPRLQWAANIFFQQDFDSPHNRETGFTQDVTYLAIADKLEIGAEMRFTHDTDKFPRHGATDEFVIGPSVSWKPNRYTVLDLAPLLGATPDSPRVAVFFTVSFEFGGGESRTSAGPIAPGNR